MYIWVGLPATVKALGFEPPAAPLRNFRPVRILGWVVRRVQKTHLSIRSGSRDIDGFWSGAVAPSRPIWPWALWAAKPFPCFFSLTAGQSALALHQNSRTGPLHPTHPERTRVAGGRPGSIFQGPTPRPPRPRPSWGWLRLRPGAQASGLEGLPLCPCG